MEIVRVGPKFYTRTHTHTHRDTDRHTHTQRHRQTHTRTETERERERHTDRERGGAYFISLVFLRKCRNKTKNRRKVHY